MAQALLTTHEIEVVTTFAVDELSGIAALSDAPAQTIFETIARIARTALEASECSGGSATPGEGLASALDAIWGLAEVAANDLDVQSEAARWGTAPH